MGLVPSHKHPSQERQSVVLLIPVASGGVQWSLSQSPPPFVFLLHLLSSPGGLMHLGVPLLW